MNRVLTNNFNEITCSPVFDVTTRKYYSNSKNRICNYNWTFFVYCGQYTTLPYLTRCKHLCGFCTKETAESARNYLLVHHDFKNKVALVYKENNFNERKGDYVFDKTFLFISEAHAYIMNKPGIMGTEQKQEILFRPTETGELTGTIWYNGYRIKLATIDVNYK